MASLESLPADLRAVLQLVLQRGRSYGDIAGMLSIDGDAVRERARAALDQLGPQTGLEPETRAQISDYLLGQLPGTEAASVRDQLADSPPQRAWARVVASELAPMASGPLPEIPSERSRRSDDHDEVAAALVAAAAAEAGEPASTGEKPPADPAAPAGAPTAGEPTPERAPTAAERAEPGADATAATALGRPGTPGRPASRRGGAILLGAGLLILVVVVVVLLVGGGSSKKNTTSTAASNTATTSTATSSTGSTSARPIAQVNLTSPTGKKGVGGVAVVVKQGANVGLILRAQGVPANTKHDAYAVWLYNSASDSHILGFVNPGVKANGVLQTAGVLPVNASHFKQLLVSLETTGKPKAPGTIVLQGALNISG